MGKSPVKGFELQQLMDYFTEKTVTYCSRSWEYKYPERGTA